MATSGKTLTNTAWTQVSSGNVYIDNRSGEPIFWVGATSQPDIGLSLQSTHYIASHMDQTIALDQPIWARTKEATITITVTEF